MRKSKEPFGFMCMLIAFIVLIIVMIVDVTIKENNHEEVNKPLAAHCVKTYGIKTGICASRIEAGNRQEPLGESVELQCLEDLLWKITKEP